MRTVIVRLHPSETDILGDIDREGTNPREVRRQVFRKLEEEVSATSSRMVGYLSHERGRTFETYAKELRLHRDVELDILSSNSPIESGIVNYQRLLASRAYAVTATEDIIQHLLAMDDVQQIHANYVYEIAHPDLDVLAGGVAAAATQIWHLGQIGLPQTRHRTTGHGVRVAVLDTGLDPSHQEFAGLAIGGHVEFDTIGAIRPPSRLRDTHTHGTHVTGILCGNTVGVAPGVELFVGLIAPQGSATFAQISAGIEWAARSDADIISISIGKRGYRAEFEQAVQMAEQANVLIVAAIGNNLPPTHRSPGDYQTVLAVGASDMGDNPWVSASDPSQGSAGGTIRVGQRSYRKPDIYAPGSQVCSCIPGRKYIVQSGTSMATPVVAGVAALVKSLQPMMSAAQIRQHVLKNGRAIALPSALGRKGVIISADQAIRAIP